jgi:hypothetical protein
VCIDGDIPQDNTSRIKLEGLTVSSTCFHERIRAEQVHVNIDGRPILNQRHTAKRGSAAPACAIVDGEVEYIGVRGWS